MRYRRFGKTELDISIFSLGTMRALESSATMTATVQRAWQLGINHFETAPSYGVSERLLGQAFRELGLPRSNFFSHEQTITQGGSSGN